MKIETYEKKKKQIEYKMNVLHHDLELLDKMFSETHPVTKKYKGKIIKLKHNKNINGDYSKEWIESASETDWFLCEGMSYDFLCEWVCGYKIKKDGKPSKTLTKYVFNGNHDIVVK